MRRMARVFAAALGVLLLGQMLVCAAANAESRLALVIGNADYHFGRLRNPVNDAHAMTATLRSLGFQVIERTNATDRDIELAIIAFGKLLKQDKGVGLFYYAGHGIQLNGHNFLIPVDVEISSEDEVAVESVDVNYVLARMAAAGNRLNIVILDACRNNPFSGSFRSLGNNGLASIDAPSGTLIAYATAPGSVAEDGSGKDGLYTGQLVQAMKLPGLKVEDVFKQVRIRVERMSNMRQVPWESSSLTGDFYFDGRPPAMRATGLIPATGDAPDISVRLNANVYHSGDTMQIGVDVSRPTYLAVYRWLPYATGTAQVSRLFPNQIDTDPLITGGTTIPTPGARDKYDLVLGFPKKIKAPQVEERMIFLSSDRPLNLGDDYSLAQFNAVLKTLPAHEVRRIDRAYLLDR